MFLLIITHVSFRVIKCDNNVSGAMLVICDINEYRKCVKEFNIPLVTQLFNTLHALCNLLVVVPENLEQVCNGDELVRCCLLESVRR